MGGIHQGANIHDSMLDCLDGPWMALHAWHVYSRIGKAEDDETALEKLRSFQLDSE